MKKSIAAGVILIAVLLGSCSGAGTDTQDGANSTDEAATQTEAVTKDAETSALEDPNAVTTDMVVP